MKRKTKKTIALLLSGAFTLQFAGCTAEVIQQQMANGLQTALTGIFRVGAQNLADELFDVDN